MDSYFIQGANENHQVVFMGWPFILLMFTLMLIAMATTKRSRSGFIMLHLLIEGNWKKLAIPILDLL